MKRANGKLIEQKVRLGYNHIDKLDFLKTYPAAHTTVFTENIQSGFRVTRIVPFNPNAVLDRFIRGCKLAMYNASLLAQENYDRRATVWDNRQKKVILSAR